MEAERGGCRRNEEGGEQAELGPPRLSKDSGGAPEHGSVRSPAGRTCSRPRERTGAKLPPAGFILWVLLHVRLADRWAHFQLSNRMSEARSQQREGGRALRRDSRAPAQLRGHGPGPPATWAEGPGPGAATPGSRSFEEKWFSESQTAADSASVGHGVFASCGQFPDKGRQGAPLLRGVLRTRWPGTHALAHSQGSRRMKTGRKFFFFNL